MARVTFYTLGCKLNFAETGALQDAFAERGFAPVAFGEPADVTVVNTCTVTDEADRKCRQVIRRALRANPETFVIVTGCYAQLQPDTIAAIPGVDAVLGAGEKFRLFDVLSSFEKGETSQIHVSCIDDIEVFGPAYNAGERTRAFLKIQDGCDYACAFCTIPLARGRSRSQSIEATVEQAHAIAGRGFREIVLSGVNIGLFGADSGEDLLDLLRRLDAVDGIARYRISSIEPNLLTDAIIDFVAASRAFQPHFHLPLQSGDDEVLGRMRRRYRRSVYTERVERIKAAMPHAGIGADVIVGFPAETDAHFETTAQYLTDLPVSYLHVFTYSERPNTVAVDRLERIGETPVPVPTRTRRNRRLRLLSEKKRQAFYREHLGQRRPVLWEHARHGGLVHGFTDNYIRVEAPHTSGRDDRIEDVLLSAIGENGHVVAGDPAFISLL
ncbi:MAG: tRNA (N(6)-L-threonylcarbamoyladenosine(37)-C(2))-methylthiotransferase MtaB [Rhodothermales bacterium]